MINKNNDLIFFFSIWSFLLGVFISDFFKISIYLIVLIIVTILFFIFINKNIIIVFILIFLLIGIFRFENIEKINNADFLLNKDFEFKGKIIKEADKRENNTHYFVELYDYNSVVKVTISHFPELKFNQEIVFKGKLQRPEKFKNENDIYFDYPKFLAKDGVAYVMFFPQIISKKDLDKNLQDIFYEKLINIKNWFNKSLRKNLKEPQSALAGGILVGSKQALGAELLEDFRRAGLIHLVVLSGYNVTIIADAIRRLFANLPLFLSKSLSIFFIICFAILSGANSTTIRASIMAIIAVLIFSTERKYLVIRALWVAAFIMVLWNPRILAGDPGFQLSFLATLGLIHLSPKISSILKFIPEKFGLRENISSTISTQIIVLPLLVKMTGEISVIALFANILILPIMPITMLLSALSGLFIFLGPITKIFSASAYVLLTYIISIAEKFSDLSFAVLKIVFNDTPI